MNKKISGLLIALLSLIGFGIKVVKGAVVEETIQDAKVLLYGIASGIAALLLVIYGIKIKMASSLEERREAKRAIIYVILGLVLIIVGASLVELIYKIPPQPPNPVIINARVWTLTNPALPWDNQTRLEFDFKNNLLENLTGVEVKVSALEHEWCDEDLFQYTFPKIGLLTGETKSYSYDNFCENSAQFSIEVKSDQNWWSFCLDCPPELGGDCNATLGNC